MSFIDELENSIDIVELVGRYTKLKKAGANYKALCPFPGHSEKTPSFVVSPAKQIGYCFGCHKGGGPVKFIMDMENCEFREAVQILGNITGREIQGFTENKEKIQIKKNLYSLYKDATNYYKASLEKHPEVKKYLMDRGLTQKDITDFHFWYADSGIALYNYLKEKWYSDQLIEQSHIFLNIQTKKDKFIGRVIFPIQNLRWDFVAFAGRILWKWEPKYLNSPASDIYDKSSILYGLYTARTSITKKDYVIITEWYMDTIALHRAWFFQTVAVSGTALTEKHITILKRLTHKIYLCFDNDKAGEQATRNSLEILKNKWLEVKIIMLTGKQKDPDEFLEAWGDFDACIEQALSPISFFIEKNTHKLESLDEKKKFLSEVLDIIKHYSDPVEQDMYIKELAVQSDTPTSILYELFKKTKQAKADTQTPIETPHISSEDIIIAYLLHQPNNTINTDAFLFTQWLSNELQKVLQNKEAFTKHLPLWAREKYKALYFLESEKHPIPEEEEKYLGKLVYQTNRNSYKQLSEHYKQLLSKGDNKALEEYSQILRTAKKHHIK